MQESAPFWQSPDIGEFNSLIEAVYAGMAQQPQWQTLLALLRQYGQCNTAFLILRPPCKDNRGRIFASGFSPAATDGENHYLTHYYHQDPFVDLTPNQPTTLSEVIGAQRLHASEFYQACLAPLDIFHILGLDLCSSEGLRANLRLTRRRGTADFGAAEKQLLNLLQPHLTRALSFAAKHRQTSTGLAAARTAISQLGVGLLILDKHRYILEANPIARDILATRDGIGDIAGKLSFSDSPLNRELASMLATFANSAVPDDTTKTFRVTRRHSPAPIGLIIKPLRQQYWQKEKSTPVAMGFLRDPGRATLAPLETLRELYQLTRREARIALLVANGLTLEEVAGQLHISRNTVRAHLRAVFPKMGVNHQHMLAGHLWRSVAQLGDSPQNSS